MAGVLRRKEAPLYRPLVHAPVQRVESQHPGKLVLGDPLLGEVLGREHAAREATVVGLKDPDPFRHSPECMRGLPWPDDDDVGQPLLLAWYAGEVAEVVVVGRRGSESASGQQDERRGLDLRVHVRSTAAEERERRHEQRP
jgi:hypothetical protein